MNSLFFFHCGTMDHKGSKAVLYYYRNVQPAIILTHTQLLLSGVVGEWQALMSEW